MSKLLIVDDEVDVREFAKSFFKKRGIEVTTAAGGNEALKLIQETDYNLALFDIHMEEMNGVDLLRKLREFNQDLKVIMVTGVEDPVIMDEVHKFNIRGYIHKPLILEELESIVLTELKADED